MISSISMKRFLPTLLSITALLLIWEIAVRALNTPAWILPAPTAIGNELYESGSNMLPHIGQTLLEVVIGIGVAILVGLATAGLLDRFSKIKEAVYPLLVISQTVPIVALAPLLIIWFGFDIEPKIIVVTLFCYFPITINTLDGLNAAEPEYLDLLRSMGANPRQIWWKVRFPAALPYFFSGLKIATTYSVVGAVVGEWVGGRRGLGIYLLRAQASFDTAKVFATIFVISILSILFFGLVFLVERWALPWTVADQPESQR